MKKFSRLFFLLPLVSGCVMIPLGSTSRNRPETLEMEGLALNGKKAEGGSAVAISLSATMVSVQDGVPVVDDKLSFGLYPGYEMHMHEQIGVFAFCSPIASCLLLGIPIVDALLFEPFLQPTDGENVLRTISPIGFCKYSLPKRKTLSIRAFALECRGCRYESNGNGFIFLPLNGNRYSSGQEISVKMIDARYPDSKEIENALKSVRGVDLSVKCH